MKIATIVTTIFIIHAVSCADRMSLSAPKKQVRVSANCGYNREDFIRGLHAVSSALQFFENHAEYLVLDAAIGTRILEAQLKQLLLVHGNLPASIATYVSSLQHRAERISNGLVQKVLEFLSGPNYTESYAGLRSSLPWIMDPSIWNVSATWIPVEVLETLELSSLFTKSVLRNETLNEETSDRCIGNLFKSCDLDKPCVQAFAQSGEDDYALTHQVLFMIIAKKQGCFQDQDFVTVIGGGKTFQEITQQLCVNVWHQMKNAYIDGNVDPSQRDLFSEQATVCALVGYPNVLDPRWFQTMLLWQYAKYGCFYHARSEVADVMDAAENSRQAHPIVKRADSFVPATKSKICSVHFTSVNIGAIGLHLRRFADICFQR